MKLPARCAAVIGAIECFYAVVSASVLGLVGIHDRGRFGKKIMLYAAMWMTYWASKWSFDYATILLTKDAATIAAGAAVITSIMGTLIGLTGWIFKNYLGDSADARRVDAGISTTEVTSLSSAKTTG